MHPAPTSPSLLMFGRIPICLYKPLTHEEQQAATTDWGAVELTPVPDLILVPVRSLVEKLHRRIIESEGAESDSVS